MKVKVKFWVELGSATVEQFVDVELPENYTEQDMRTEYESWVWDQITGAWEVLEEKTQGKSDRT